MRIKIICVGKLKEKYLVHAAQEYIKRLGRYCKLECIEVRDEKIQENYSEAQKQKAVALEGERILKHLGNEGKIATLEIHGKQLTSDAFAETIHQLGVTGTSSITFIIGGSLGLSPEVLARSTWRLSFSKMTFPHQLFRVMLLEQIYRSFKINHHETYHK